MLAALKSFVSGTLGRIATGVALTLCALIVVLWFQNGHLRTSLQGARDAAAMAQKETERTELALTAAEARAASRRSNDASQRQDEDVINAQPQTFECADSPAMRAALSILRDREALRDAARDPE